MVRHMHAEIKSDCHLDPAESQHLSCAILMQVLPLLSPERGFPMQKGCRALLIDKLGRLLAAASDGCCYLLDAESLHQDARLILHPSQTGLPSPPAHAAQMIQCAAAHVRNLVVQALKFCKF